MHRLNLAENHGVSQLGLWLILIAGRCWLSWVSLALLAVHNFLLQELQILAKDFYSESIEIHSLSAGLIHSVGLFLNLLIFLNDILLNLLHFIAVALDCHQFIVRLCCLDLEENLEDLLILVHNVNKAQFLLLIFTHEADKFTTLLNFVERLHKFVSEILYPFDILILYLDQSVANTLLPFAND